MSLKTASLFALLGMIVLTVLVAAGFLRDLTAFTHDAVPAVTLLASLVHLLASLSVTIFFLVFYRAHS